jgi:hypothetical protein
MSSASNGMMLLRHVLQPILQRPLPVTWSENLVTGTTLRIMKARNAEDTCPVCKANPFFGYGDCGAAIGLDPAAVTSIHGPRRCMTKYSPKLDNAHICKKTSNDAPHSFVASCKPMRTTERSMPGSRRISTIRSSAERILE